MKYPCRFIEPTCMNKNFLPLNVGAGSVLVGIFNRMQKSLKASITAVLVIITAFLPTITMTGQNAEKILADATGKMKAHTSIQMEFSYQMVNPEAGINETTQGKAVMSGDKYRLEIASQMIISDGKTLWTVLTDAEEVQVNDATEGEDAFSPTKMLTDYKENYSSKLISGVNELNGRSVYLLELVPHEVKNFMKVNLFLIRDNLQPYRIELFDFNESVYKYTLNNFETGVTLQPDVFTFSEKEFPGFDVIDMR